MPVATKPSLTLKRHLKAPIAKVFQALTRPEALKQWFGPSDSYTISEAKVDLRVGGAYRIVMVEESGAEHRVGGKYREIVPNERLVYSWAWESTPEVESLVTITLKAAGQETDLTLRHEQLADAKARDMHRSGWTGTLVRLERYLG